jgi:hypothetical protein
MSSIVKTSPTFPHDAAVRQINHHVARVRTALER